MTSIFFIGNGSPVYSLVFFGHLHLVMYVILVVRLILNLVSLPSFFLLKETFVFEEYAYVSNWFIQIKVGIKSALYSKAFLIYYKHMSIFSTVYRQF